MNTQNSDSMKPLSSGRKPEVNSTQLDAPERKVKKLTMANPIGNLNKVFESRIRLGIMSSLMVNAELSFNDLKQTLEVSDGNLATHLVNLEENGYIKVHKGFIGRKTNTTYSITKAGEKAFKEHVEALENMIKGMK
jgi:DNA-binding HxlR family transcriptional regulator